MIPTTNDLPDWARTLSRQIREHEAQDGQLYREMSDKFEAARLRAKYVPLHVTKREAVARFTDVVHAFASAVLAAPADYTAHAVDYATGLLNEAVDYVKAEQAATRGIKHV